MKIIRVKDERDMGRKAANIIASQVILKDDSVLGLATGSTVLEIYRQLIDGYQKGDLDFSKIRSVNLDEYVGLPADHPQSYHYFMNENLFRHINIRRENTNVPDGTAADSEAECDRYEALIQSLGGIDLQLLGLGLDGHIGFNEPDRAFAKKTQCIALDASTIKANARFFQSEDEVPKKAVTMGIGTIMRARRVLLCVTGAKKAEILQKVLCGPVTPEVPGSILQMHPDLTVVADADALPEI